MTQSVIYTTRFCPFCVRAKQVLEAKGESYKEVAVDGDREARQQLMQKTGSSTVPQIWLRGQYVGGCDELMALGRSGELDQLLAKAK
jgi:glutaredoxin 3